MTTSTTERAKPTEIRYTRHRSPVVLAFFCPRIAHKMRKHSLRDMDITSYMVEHGKGYIRSSVAALPYYSFAVLFYLKQVVDDTFYMGRSDSETGLFPVTVSFNDLDYCSWWRWRLQYRRRDAVPDALSVETKFFWRESSERPRTDGIDFFPVERKRNSCHKRLREEKTTPKLLLPSTYVKLTLMTLNEQARTALGFIYAEAAATCEWVFVMLRKKGGKNTKCFLK